MNRMRTTCFWSVATLLEIRVGVELTDKGKKRDMLERWLVDVLPERFDDRIIPVERHVADLTGRIMVRFTEGRLGEMLIDGCADWRDGYGERDGARDFESESF